MGRLIALFVALFVLLPATAWADGHIEVPRGPIELEAVGNAFEASFDVRNTGDKPLYVSRVAPRTDSDDVRLPRHVTARFAAGQTSGTIPPGGVGTVRVTWVPDRDALVRSFYGHVVVTSTDERAGEVAVGISAHAGRFGALSKHLLSTLVTLPLAASALLALLVLAVGSSVAPRRARMVALGVSLVCAALALFAWGTFDADLVRAEGGEGLQHVERAIGLRALGVEIFLAVDGASLPILVICALAMPCGVLASWEQRKSPAVFFALYMMLAGASLGAIVSLDGVMYVFCLAIATMAGYLLVGLFGRADPQGDARDAAAAANRMLIACGVGVALIAVALATLHAAEVHTFLVDGSPVAHSWAFPELARIKLGEPVARKALVLSLVGVGLIAGLFPLHVWLAPVLRSAPPAVAMMTCVGLGRAAMLGLLRLDAAVLSDSLRWAAPTLVALGAAGTVYGALVATAERNLVGVASFGFVSLSGASLVGIATPTQQGLLGGLTGMAVSGAAIATALLALGALRDRTGTVDATAIRGLGIEAPMLAAILGIAALAVGGLPGTAGFWSTWLIGVAAVVSDMRIAIVILVAAVLLAASQVMPMLRVVRGRLPEALRRDEALTPYGGHVPDLRTHELAAIAPLLLLILLLGFYPAPLIGRAQATARDLSEMVTPPSVTHVE